MRFDSESFMMFFVFAIPIVAIVMGVTHRIVRTLGEQRLMELAQRERIAAIERGIDPSKLPPLPHPAANEVIRNGFDTWHYGRRAQGLLIGGLITLAAGVGICLMVYVLQPNDRSWAAGLVPALIGVALLVSAWIVWPRGKSGPTG